MGNGLPLRRAWLLASHFQAIEQRGPRVAQRRSVTLERPPEILGRCRRLIAATARTFVVAVLTSAMGCSDTGQPDASTMIWAKCSAKASCSEQFRLGEVDYGISCAAVRPELVGAEPLGRGEHAGVSTQAHRLKTVDPIVLLAVAPSSVGCVQERDNWRPAIALGADLALIKQVMCEVLAESAAKSRSCE
jgi:hypothetical protein